MDFHVCGSTARSQTVARATSVEFTNPGTLGEEHPAVVSCPERLHAVTPQRHQVRRQRHDPRLSRRAVLQPALVVILPRIGPPLTRLRQGAVRDQPAPARPGQTTVRQSDGNSFFRAQARVVHPCEQPDQPASPRAAVAADVGDRGAPAISATVLSRPCPTASPCCPARPRPAGGTRSPGARSACDSCASTPASSMIGRSITARTDDPAIPRYGRIPPTPH